MGYVIAAERKYIGDGKNTKKLRLTPKWKPVYFTVGAEIELYKTEDEAKNPFTEPRHEYENLTPRVETANIYLESIRKAVPLKK